jgi:biotin transport system substrate-specific component
MTPNHSTTLIEAWWPTQSGSFLKSALVVVGGSLLLALSAKVKVPIEPVPVTMQLFVVLALGLTMGMRLATATVLLYLAQGAAGLPVFTGTPEKGIGLVYMMGTTGGYLVGYLAAAALTGWFADRGFSRNPVFALAAAFLGVAIVYGLGLLWLGTLVGWDKPVLAWGLWPFLLPDAVKATLAGLIVPAAWALTHSKQR